MEGSTLGIIAVWGHCGQMKINQVQRIQNCAARTITNSSFYGHYKQFFQEHGQKAIEKLINVETKTRFASP